MRLKITRLIAWVAIACGLVATPAAALASTASVVAATDAVGNGGFEWTT